MQSMLGRCSLDGREVGATPGRGSWKRCVRAWAMAIVVGCSPLAAFGHDDHEHDEAEKPKKVAGETLYRPSPMPDRIVLTWKGDPATSQAVTWRTDATIARGQAQIAVAEAGASFAGKAKTLAAETTKFESETGPARYHTVLFENLSPKTKYAYRVGDGVNWTEWFHFQTASDKPEPFSFVYFGDAQNDVRSFWSRVVREAQSDAPKARFFLHAGDLINHANRDVEWGEWHHAGGWLNATIPTVATPGNHEYAISRKPDGAMVRGLSGHWRPQFTFPENGPAELVETTYTFDYQGVRVISLNSNERFQEQVPWLENVLKENPARWTIVTFHHPVYSTARGRDNPHIRMLWKPIFDKYRVDLVLQGHDHSYARTGLDVPENLSTGASVRSGATVYVVSVSGPKMYDLERRDFMRRAAEDTQLYQIIHVDGDRLRYEARTAVGELYDAFTLRKRPGEVNELVEEAPATPERLRPEETKNKKAARRFPFSLPLKAGPKKADEGGS